MTAGAIQQNVAPDRVQAPLDRAVLPSADVAAIQTLLAAGKLDGPDGALALLRQRGAIAGLDQRHVDTLGAIATDRRYGTPDRSMAAARMYLQLLGSGCFAFLAETERTAGQQTDPAAVDRSRAAMDDLLRSSIAVWRGDDVRPEMKNGRDRPQRLAEFVTQLNRAMERGGEQGRFTNALRSARAAMLTPTGEQRFAQPTRSEYDGLTFPPAQPALVAQPGVRAPAGAAVARPTGPNPRAMTLLPAAQAAPLKRRGPRPAGEGPTPLAAPAVAPAQMGPPQRIRGTDTPWSPDAVARYINENSSDNKRLDALGGLRLQDRIAVAEAYARLRGQPHVQGQALAYLIEQMSGGRSGINGQLFRDMLRPSNSDGITSEHILINIDATGGSWLSTLTGIGGANHEAIERVLMFRSRAELAQIDAAMRLPPEQGGYGRSLRDTLKLVDDSRARARLLFLFDVPRRDTLGEIPQAELQAWHVRQALNNFSTLSTVRNNVRAFSTPEWGNIFGSITAMSPRELQAVAKAYYEQLARDGRTPTDGGDGSTGNLADSAFGRALLRESAAPIRIAGGDQQHALRMRIALQGLRFEMGNFAPPQLPNETPQAYEQRAYPIIAQAEAQHRQRVAQYIAVTIALAKRGQIATDEIQGALALIKRPPPAGQQAQLDGRPFPQDVIAQYGQVSGEQFSSFDEQVIKMVQHANYSVAGTSAQQNTWNLIAGEGRDSGASRAMLLVAALSGPLGMLGGPYRQRTYQLLDLRGVPESQREAMRAQMRQQYALLMPGHSLDADVQSAFGPNITLPSGNVIPSQAMRLAQRGVISNAERIIYALYEPGMFGLARAENMVAVSRILGELTPLEKVATRAEFQRLTGRDLRAELDNYPGREARMAAMATRVFPHERDLLGAQAMLYLNAATSDPNLAAQRAAVTGRSPDDITDFLSRNFADQAGLTAMRQLVDQTGGAAQFSLAAVDSAADLQTSVRAATDAAIGNGLTRFIQSGFSNAEEGLGVRRRTLDELAERAQRELAATGSVSPETQSEMGFIVRDVRERLRARGADVDRGTELISNIAVTAALVTTLALAPETGALWMSVIGGGTGLATRMALGQVDTVSQGVGIFLRDAAKGLAFQQSAALMAVIPPEAGILENAMVGMAAGYNTGAITSAAAFITDPELWRLDPGQALDNFSVNYSNATSGGMIAGGLSAALVRAIRGNAKPPQQQDQGPGPGPDPGSNGTPARGQPPIDRPVHGGPTRPGGPERPVDPHPPARPTGPLPGNIGSPTGPMPGRPTGPTTIGGQNVGSPTGPAIGRPTGATGSGSQNVGVVNGPVVGRPSGQITTTTTGGNGTVTPARPPATVVQPSRDVGTNTGTPVVTNSGTPVATNTGAPVAGNTGTSIVGGRPTGTAGTAIGGPIVRPGGATRSLAIPGSPRSAVVVTENTDWTMNVATIGWSAIAVAASTNGGLDYFNSSATEDLRRRVEELRRRVDGESRIPTNEMRRALETMSEPERREQVLGAGSAFAFSALAYMEQHNGRLPGSDRDPSDFNTLLDLAWTNAGLAAGRPTDRVSRAEKVRQLVAFHLGVPQPTGPAAEPGQQPRQPPGPVPPGEEQRGPRGPARGPLASPQFYDQLIAGTGSRLRNVNRGWIDRNLQNAIKFRTGADAPQFPQGNAQDWIRLVNQLPDRPLPEVIRDDAEGLRAFGFRMPQNRQGQRERPLDVTPELMAVRDRARAMAPLGEPADRNPVSVPQFFEALPALRQFMVAATGKDEAQISAMTPQALAGAIVAYKDRLRTSPQSAALMQGINQDPVIERRTLEAHQRAAGVSGPNAVPDDPVEFGRRWQAVMQRLARVDADAQKDRENVAAASAEAARAIERGRERGLISEEQRTAMTAAFAQSVLSNAQGEQRMNRLRAFIMGTQDSPQVASDVFAVMRPNLTPAELRALAIGLAGNVREPNTAAPAGTIEVDMAKVPLGIIATLDRLPGLERDPEYREASRRLRQVTIIRRLQENRLNEIFASDDLEYVVRQGPPQMIAAVLARSGEVTSGEELVVRQLINASNAGRADRAGVVLHSLYAAGQEDPRFAALAVSLAGKLWNEQTIAQVNWSRRDDLAVAVGWDQLNGARQKSDPCHPLLAALAQSEAGRATLRSMVSSIEWDARYEGRWSWEWILSDRVNQLLRAPLAPPPPAQPQ